MSPGKAKVQETICGGGMDDDRETRKGRDKAWEFLAGRHRGAPVDYVMALAIVLVAMLVIVAGAI